MHGPPGSVLPLSSFASSSGRAIRQPEALILTPEDGLGFRVWGLGLGSI